MRRARILVTMMIASLSLAAAPAALAKKHSTVGNSTGTPTMNLCLLSIDCTYVNYHHGKPADVVKHSGTVVNWSLNAGSTGGQVQLRVLRPIGAGKLKAIRTSATETVASIGINTFSTHLKVKRGDVLALSNSSSGIYMENAPAGTCVRYFNSPLADGSSGKPTQIAPQLHLLLSAQVNS